MTSVDESLGAVRQEIDQIDDQIHDLLIKRTQVVETVRDLKRGQKVKIRPAREAEILIRLLDRHRGNFPKRELIRIWREMIVATLSFEGPFSVAVHMPDPASGFWDLARDQYGAFSPFSAHSSVRRVIEAVRSHEAMVGILPLPTQDDTDPWWRHLVTDSPEAPRVIARLPVAGPGNGRDPNLEALVIAPIAQEPTGRDRSFVALDVEEAMSPRALRDALAREDLEATFLSRWLDDDQKPSICLLLAEVDGFVAADDARLARLADRLGIAPRQALSLGGYARPFTDAELGSETRSEQEDRQT